MARPILLNSCARAQTTAEARYRLDYPLAPSRATRVIGLDPEALAVVWSVSKGPWFHAGFYSVVGDHGIADDLDLADINRKVVSLVDELLAVDTVIMVAATDDGASAARTIGAACSERGIMAAGLVMGSDHATTDALLSLRPHARILLVPADEDDLFELLRAIRA